jgi:hypothetical protein
MSKRILPGVIDSISRGYNILGSSRFDSDKSAYFSQNFKYNGNQKTWTFSTWIKLNDVSTYQCIFSQAGTPLLIGYVGGRFRVDLNGVGFFETTEYFRDPNAWYHYMLVLDTTQGTAANRAKIFINGVQSTITFTSWTPALNTDYGINSAVEHRIGQYGIGGYLLKSHLAETHFIDGQALTPSSFGEIAVSTRTWVPKRYSGTYGRNGFFLNHFKKAMKFDGRTTYYDTGVSTWSSTNTWSLWIKPTVSGGPLVNKVSYYAFSTNDFPWQMNYNSNTGKIEVLVDSGNDYSTDQTIQSTGSQNLTDGNWHHVAVVTKSQSYVKIYIDGILDTNAATSVNIAPGSRNYFLGRDSFPYGGGEPGRFYNGSMADVRYFPSELTLGEVQSIYNTTTGEISSNYVGCDDSLDTYFMSQITFNGSAGARRSTAPTINVADSKKGIISMWLDFTGGNGVAQDLWTVRNNSTDGNSLSLRKESNNSFSFRVGTGDATTYGSIGSSQTITSSSGLTHLAVAWDLSISKMQMYVNGVSTSSSPGAFTNANVDIANSPFHGIGGGQFNPISPNLQARVGQVYVNYGEFLDLSVSSNLNKFYNNGTPISLGSSGEEPTGNIPTFLLDGINITKNHGGGGDLDVTVGTFSVGGTITGARCSNRNGFKAYSIGYVNGVMGSVTKDSPTMYGSDTGKGAEVSGNYMTWNILTSPNQFSSSDSAAAISLNGTKISKPSGGTSNTVSSFRLPGTGKWYWEYHILGTSANTIVLGQQASIGYSSDWTYRQNGTVGNLTGQTSISGFNAGDIISIAYNGDDGQITILKNGVALLLNNGVVGGQNNERFLWVQTNSPSDIVAANFGSTPYVYAAPSGYKSINTNNLSTPSIIDPSTYHDVIRYTGNGTSLKITTPSGFKPDLMWIRRIAGGNNGIHDTTRSTNRPIIITDSTAGESAGGSYISSFDNDGFTLNNNTSGNGSGSEFMGWLWKEAGQSGLDIVSYTGNGSNRTISHNLAAVPKFMMIKRTDTTANWIIYHASIPTPGGFPMFFTTATAVDAGVVFNNSNPTSTTFAVGTDSTTNANGGTYIAYIFAEIPGFSSFGRYTGNGSTDGPFVHLGFKPSWFMIKNLTSNEQWAIMDDRRPVLGNNNTGNFIPAQSTGGEDTNASFHQVDKVSNGFKIRAAAQELMNSNGHSYIYMAFAENPFKYATAR